MEATHCAFCQRQNEEMRANLAQLQKAQHWNIGTQGPFESLEMYLDDINAKASRLQLTDAGTMQCFVHGLRQELKEHFALHQNNVSR